MAGSTVLLWCGLGSALAIGGCGGEDLVESAAAPVPPPPSVSAVAGPNPENVLSTVVTFTAERAESARVVYLGDNLPADSTPYMRVADGPDTIVTLGLHPGTTYRNVVEAVGPGGASSSDTVSFSTASLPDPLQRVGIAVRGSGGPGLTLTAVQVGGDAVFALAFDSAGAIRWYRRFAGSERVPGELKQQANGHFTLYRGGSTGVEPAPGHYVEFTPAGDSIRAIAVAPPRYLDNHELWITAGPDGADRFHYFTYDRRTSDLRSIGGAAEVSLAGHQLVRLRSDGATELEWNAWDHLTFDEWIEPPRPEPSDPTGRDFDHPNSLAFDRDGNYIVSFRNLGQVMKIDATSGEVMWRLGGIRSDFAFRNDPLGGFSTQHSASVLPNGHVLIFDNGTRHQPPESRAVEYALDTTAMTATLVWEFRPRPPIYTPAVGLAQRLKNGNTVVGYAMVGHALEVTAGGGVTWEAELSVDGEPAFVYRLLRIVSLYGYLDP